MAYVFEWQQICVGRKLKNNPLRPGWITSKKLQYVNLDDKRISLWYCQVPPEPGFDLNFQPGEIRVCSINHPRDGQQLWFYWLDPKETQTLEIVRRDFEKEIAEQLAKFDPGINVRQRNSAVAACMESFSLFVNNDPSLKKAIRILEP